MLHSFAGAVPFAAFMLLDLWANAKAAEGPVAFAHALEGVRHLPNGAVAVFGAPLLFHATLGTMHAIRGLARVGASTGPAYGHALQRLTGLVALAYVGVRIALVWRPLRAPGAHPSDVQASLVATLSATWHGAPLAAYATVLALAACSLHLATGLRAAAVRWGLAPTRDGRRIATVVGALVGLVAFLHGARSTVALATGWAPFQAPPALDGGACETPPVGGS